MNESKTYRLFIGSNNETKRLEEKKAINEVSKLFEGFTCYRASGYWKGEKENSLVLEVSTDEPELVKELALILCRKLNQQAVGVVESSGMQFISR